VRRIAAVATLVLVVIALCACSVSRPAARVEPVPFRASQITSATASANGVDLSIALSKVGPRRVDVAVTVAVPGSKEVTVTTPGGSLARVEMIDASGTTVLDSRQIDREAIASNPGFEPDASISLSDGSSSSSTYRASLGPGRYTLTATTFGPMALLRLTDIEIP
jgi:hypothetical protein